MSLRTERHPDCPAWEPRFGTIAAQRRGESALGRKSGCPKSFQLKVTLRSHSVYIIAAIVGHEPVSRQTASGQIKFVVGDNTGIFESFNVFGVRRNFLPVFHHKSPS